LIPIAIELFGIEKVKNISIGMGASAGEVIFSTLGCNPCIFYTGIGKDISFAKKVESVSGRDSVVIEDVSSSFCKDKILISDELQSKFTREHGVTLKSIDKVNIPYTNQPQTFHYIEDIDMDKCPMQRKCPSCQILSRRNNCENNHAKQ